VAGPPAGGRAGGRGGENGGNWREEGERYGKNGGNGKKAKKDTAKIMAGRATIERTTSSKSTNYRTSNIDPIANHAMHA
jgi:hypothetical protein